MRQKFFFIIPLLFTILLLFLFISPSLIKLGIIYGLIFLTSLSTGIVLIKGKIKQQWPFLVQLMFFVLSGLGFFLFLSGIGWQIAFVLAFNIILGFFLFHVYQLFYHPRNSQPEIFKKTIFWFNFIISYWFLFTLTHYLTNNFTLPGFLITILIVFISFFWLFTYQELCQKGEIDKNSLLIKSLVFSEMFLVVLFLPLGVYLTTLSLSLLFVIIIGLDIRLTKLKYSFK